MFKYRRRTTGLVFGIVVAMILTVAPLAVTAAPVTQGISGSVMTSVAAGGGSTVPVGNATVTVWTAATTPVVVGTTTTNASGYYEIPLAVGDYYVEFEASGFATQFYDSAGALAQATLVKVAKQEVTFLQVAGANRYATAIAASKKAFPEGSEYVVVATGMNWPDALGGSALAGALDAPILLTATSSLPAEVRAEIVRLGATKAIILGGTPAVSAAVMGQIDAISGVSVERISGPNRYDTAIKVAARTIAVLGDGYDGTAFIATGMNFPDALGASPLAAAAGWPIYLANPNQGSNAGLVSVMKAAGVTDAILLGGANVVSDTIRVALGTTYETRLSGANRYDTAVVVATYGAANADLTWNKVAIATGQNFPDALSGGALQGKDGSVLLLTPTASLNANVAAKLAANKAVITEVRFLGGPPAVSQGVRNQVKALFPLRDQVTSGIDALLVDRVAPEVTITGVTDGGLYKASVTPVITITGQTSQTITLNGAAFTSGTPVTAEGAYTLVATASDEAGNTTAKTVAFEIDLTAPEITVTGVADGGLYKASVTPVITITGQTSQTITLNGEAWTPAEITAGGDYTLVVTATDAAGNTANKTVAFEIDLTAPALTITGVTDTVAGSLSGTVEGGFTLPTTNVPSIDHELSLAAGSVSSEALADAYNGLTLVPAAGQTAALVTYYEARGVPEPYLTYLKAAAAGTEPFVFLKADGTALTLVDAAKYDVDGTDNPMAVPDDFPLGTYTVAGTVADAAGNTTVVTFKLIVKWTEFAAVAYVQDNTTLTGDLDALVATFPETIPAVVVAEPYQIDSRIALGQALPAGTTVTIARDGVTLLTDIELAGTGPYWFTELFDPDAPRADFDAGYGGSTETYRITVTGPGTNPEIFQTTATIESVISKDGFATETVLASTVEDVVIPADATAPLITITGATADGTPMAGDLATGYILETGNDPAINHLLQLEAGSFSSEPLAAAYTGLYLVPEVGQVAALDAYYADKSRVLADSYSETYLSDELDVTMWDPTGQTFTAGAAGMLDSCQFLLRRVGAVTGDIYAKLWAHSGTFGVNGLPTGTALATSAAVEVSTISESWSLVTFTFDNTVPLVAGTPYVITVEYPTGVDGTLYVGLDWDGTILHAGTGIYTDGTGWNVGTADVPFYVYVSQPNPYLTYLKAAAAGTEPFAYLKADGTTLILVDAAQHDLGAVDVDMTVSDDFPLGTYTVTGMVADAAGNTTPVTFKLVVSSATP